MEWHHVYPLNDLIEHKTEGTDCECMPRVNVADYIVVHNALDNREFDEIAQELGGYDEYGN